MQVQSILQLLVLSSLLGACTTDKAADSRDLDVDSTDGDPSDGVAPSAPEVAGTGPKVQAFVLQPPGQGGERLGIAGLPADLNTAPGRVLPSTLRLADARVLEAQQALEQ